MKVSIIIPNWNGESLLEKNLPLVIKAKENKKNGIIEIIIVDDKSTDDSVAFLEKNYLPQIKLVRHKENRGFSAAINTGVRAAIGSIICLLNTDVIPSDDFLEAVLPHFSDKKVFGVSLHEAGYGYAYGKFENGFVGFGPGKEKDQASETFWVSGGSGVFKKEIWKKLKGFDEALFSPFYWEDLDICYRAAKRGYKLLWEPKAMVLHKHETTTSKLSKGYVDVIRQRNQLLFIWKNITSPSLTKRHLGSLASRLLKNPGYLRVFLAALKKLRQARKARLREKKEAKVSDEALFAQFK